MTGIDTQFSRKAPAGKFRVVGVDTFDRTDWLEGDFNTKANAIDHAKSRGGAMLKFHVYDDAGRHVFDAGVF